MTGQSYAAEQVRLYDHDRYLTAIFAPAAVREQAFALYAFNLEIAKTSEVVSEPLIGMMRLQWWRDSLDRLYAGQTIAHEVAEPLGAAVRAAGLERRLFDRVIDAREADLDEAPPPDMDALVTYAADTAAPLVALAMALTGPLESAAREAAEAVGTGWALTGLIRAVPFHAARRRVRLPADRLAAAGVGTGRLFDLKPDPGLATVVREVGEAADAALARGRDRLTSVPAPQRWPLLQGVLAQLYVDDLRRAGWDPFSPKLAGGRPLAVLNLAAARLLGRYRG